MPTPIKSIAIIGAGNGGYAAAVDLSLRHFDVRLYGRDSQALKPAVDAGGIEYEGIFGNGFAAISLITSEIKDAITGADLVLITTPTHAHAAVAAAIAPYLQKNQIVMAAPGHTVLLIPRAIEAAGGAYGSFCDTTTLPYICRKTAANRIRISRAAKKLFLLCFRLGTPKTWRR